MNSKIYNLSDKLIEISFYLLFFFVPFIFIPNASELFEINKMFTVFVLSTVIVSSWLIKSITHGKFIFQKTFWQLPLFAFLLSQIASTLLSIDIHTSIWGYYSRLNGGLLSTICYILLYFAWVSNMGEQKTKKALTYLLISGGFISLWGIMEHFGHSPSCVLIRHEFNTACWVQDVQSRVFATFGQPNWLASWVVALMPLAWMFYHQKSGREKWIYLTISTLLFLSLIFTKSRSGLLGFVVSTLLFVALFYKAQKMTTSIFTQSISKIFLCISIVLLLFGSIMTPSVFEIFSGQKESLVEQNVGTSLERGGTESGAIRKIVWEGAIGIWKAFPVFGSGVETFGYSYYNFRPVAHNNTSEWELLYNKAHNEYLNYLSTTGSVGLTTYMLLVASYLFWGFKKLQNEKEKIFLVSFISSFVSLLVTNFFGFSVVATSLLFFLIPAFTFTISNKEEVTNTSIKNSFKKLLLTLLILVAGCFTIIKIFSFWSADFLYAESISLSRKGLDGQAFIKIRSALENRMDEPNYYDQMAKTAANLAILKAETEEASAAAELAELARDSTLVATSISPYHLSLLKSQSTTFLKLSIVDIKYLEEAVKPLERAILLAPTDPKVRYNLGILYSRTGDVRAQETLEKAVDLKPDYYDARVSLAKIYTEKKEYDKARNEYQWILDNLNPEDEEIKLLLESLPK